MERGGRDGEDAADAEGGGRRLALEGLGEGEDEVVGVDVVCVCAKRLMVSPSVRPSVRQSVRRTDRRWVPLDVLMVLDLVKQTGSLGNIRWSRLSGRTLCCFFS